jgi:hypothetical protein
MQAQKLSYLNFQSDFESYYGTLKADCRISPLFKEITP